VEEAPNSVLLESSRPDDENRRSLLFLDPVRTISLREPHEIEEFFEQVENAVAEGYYLAGYISYECGCVFEPRTDHAFVDPGIPLAWFGVYRHPIEFDHESGEFVSPPPRGPRGERHPFRIGDLRFEIREQEYRESIRRIRKFISSGETYQVNFTDRYSFTLEGSTSACYRVLRNSQRAGYAAFINTGDLTVLSFSPELFFRISGNRLLVKPMKGTAHGGGSTEEENRQSERLQADEKNRSENLMIVDLLRNDLGRLARVGSVKVRELFAVERFETLLQMTSTIECELSGKPTFYEIFRSLFPSGSVTGAPKIRTMQIIHELERNPRGIYTGAIGYIAPNRDAAFNVAIRTLVVREGKGTMGIGSGIVFDSDPAEEYEECRLKAKFLSEGAEPFQLIESLRWDEGYPLLDLHLKRLKRSAQAFGYRIVPEEIAEALKEHGAHLAPGAAFKVRLLLGSDGGISISNQKLGNLPSSGKVCLSRIRTSSPDIFLLHKTTRRRLYDEEHSAALRNGYDDVLFLNERGEVTEGAISNIFLEERGHLCTPPVSCGLLPGVHREHVLGSTAGAVERILTPADLLAAERLFICNAVQGMREVKFVRE